MTATMEISSEATVLTPAQRREVQKLCDKHGVCFVLRGEDGEFTIKFINEVENVRRPEGLVEKFIPKGISEGR